MAKITNFPPKKFAVIINFVLRVILNFRRTYGGTRAGSLGFTLLLSFIPFTISIVTILSWLSISNSNILKIEHHFFDTYFPHTGAQVFQEVKIFVQHSYRLSMLGFSSFVLTTYMMLFAIEKQLNAIWHVRIHFRMFKSLLTHTIFLIGVPSIIGMIVVIRIYSHMLFHSPLLDFSLAKILPILVGILSFTLIYKVIPGHKVNLRNAFTAGITAAIFFNLARRLFLFSCSHLFLNYHMIYGSLAFVPLLLIWIYLCCLNLLFCAEIIYALESSFNHKLHRKIVKIWNHISKVKTKFNIKLSRSI